MNPANSIIQIKCGDEYFFPVIFPPYQLINEELKNAWEVITYRGDKCIALNPVPEFLGDAVAAGRNYRVIAELKFCFKVA